MKQVFVSRGKPFVRDVDLPVLDVGMVLVRVHYSFVSSGTEKATLRASGSSLVSRALKDVGKSVQKLCSVACEHGVFGAARLVKSSMDKILAVGYSCSGQVVATSPGTSFAPGDWVACAGARFAVHAEFVAVPKNLVVRLSGAENLKEASVVAIASVALQGLRRSGVCIGESVCVVGLGLIGQLTVQLARIAGCKVFGVDIDERRLAIGLSLGCEKVSNAKDPSLYRLIHEVTQGYGVDTTIITASTSSGEIIEQAISLTRKRGKIVVVGDVKLDFERESFYLKELDLLISCSYGPGRYDQKYEASGCIYPYEFVRWTETRNMQFVVDCIGAGLLDINPLIEKMFSVGDAVCAYNYLEKKSPLGIVFSHTSQRSGGFRDVCQKSLVCKSSHLNGNIGVAVIGAGGFVKTKLLPILKTVSGIELTRILSSTAESASNLAKQFSIPNFGADFEEVLYDPNVHAIVIATPHKLHASQSLKALQAGKAVFCEKPAALSFDELYGLKSFLKEHNPLYQVDFNRSHAPFIGDVRKVLAETGTPINLIYRMNVGAIPAGHWLELPENGGRIVGEMCHLIELVLGLVAGKPRSICVSVPRVRSSEAVVPENVSASISFIDGSCATFAYTSLGNSALPKERVELFWGGKSIVLEDFVSMKSYGVFPGFDKKVSRGDKGHAAIIKDFFSRVRAGRQLPDDVVERILQASEITLIIDHLSRLGGGEYNFELENIEERFVCAG